jgi:hypothetical protein
MFTQGSVHTCLRKDEPNSEGSGAKLHTKETSQQPVLLGKVVMLHYGTLPPLAGKREREREKLKKI